MKKQKPYNIEEETFFSGSTNVASANECTGLMMTPAQNEDESDSLSDIYDIPVTDITKDEKIWKK